MVRNKWGSIPDAAELAGVSSPTMRRYVEQKLVVAKRVGPKLIRVDLDSVEALGTAIGGDGE